VADDPDVEGAAEQAIDRTVPGERWTFDAEVTACFDNMLQRSIPQYDVMRAATTSLAARYTKPGSTILDLGCSRGEALAPLVARFGRDNQYIGADISGPMFDAARRRFADEIEDGLVSIQEVDLRHSYPIQDWPVSVTLCVLTLQFVPIEYRQRLVQEIYANTQPGGVLLLVEKVLGSNAEITAAMVEIYHARKLANGYSQEEIDRKRFSLEGVLVPVTARWNEDLLRGAGFAEVDCYWRWMNFAAWIAKK